MTPNHPDVVHQLLEHRSHAAAYHNHKEQMAYGATTLYLAVLGYAVVNAGTVGQPNSITRGDAWGFLFLAALGAWTFVIWQLRNREVAADIVHACNCLLAQSFSRSFDDNDLEVAFLKDQQYPKILAEEVARIRRDRHLFGGPRASECLTYAVMALWTVTTWWVVFR